MKVRSSYLDWTALLIGMRLTLDGRALLVDFRRGSVLTHFNFKKAVRDVQFSPDGMYAF